MPQDHRQSLAGECNALSLGSEDTFGRLKFSIMHGNGNVLIIVDEELSDLAAEEVDGAFARKICQSFQTIRVEGIAFTRTKGEAVRMTYFERDGTNSVMCGNALRCSALYSFERGYISAEDFITTDDGDKWVSVSQNGVRVAVGAAREFQRIADDRYFVFSGLPHLVIFVNDLNNIDVPKEGSALRYDQALCDQLQHPEGIHVDYLRMDPDGISIRTYEVGVEDETLACGTGVAASAFIANKVANLPFPICVGTRGGDIIADENEHGLTISGAIEYLFTNIEAEVTIVNPGGK